MPRCHSKCRGLSRRRPRNTHASGVLFDFGGMPRGYGWIFPKKDHLNVGVFSSRVTRLGFSIPIRNRRHEFERNHVLLVGDAAGFAESFHGEGRSSARNRCVHLPAYGGSRL